MKLLITGGSGTLGREITKLAIANNHQVNILTRNKKLVSNNINLKYYYWNPNKEEIDSECFKGVNSVINLAGFSVFKLWTKTNKSKILSSRLISTLFILKQIKEKRQHRALKQDMKKWSSEEQYRLSQQIREYARYPRSTTPSQRSQNKIYSGQFCTKNYDPCSQRTCTPDWSP